MNRPSPAISFRSALDNDPLATQLNPFEVTRIRRSCWGDQIAKQVTVTVYRRCRAARLYREQWTGPYVEDPTRNEQNSNPGVVDCTRASINDRSWGILKAMFGESNKFKYR